MGFLPLGRQASIPARRRRACLPAGRADAQNDRRGLLCVGFFPCPAVGRPAPPTAGLTFRMTAVFSMSS